VKRAISVLEVSDASIWDELAAVAPLEPHLEGALHPTARIARPSLEKELIPLLSARGIRVLLRRARRDDSAPPLPELDDDIARLPSGARRLLEALQRHAVDGETIVGHAADPEKHIDDLRVLLGASLVARVPDSDPLRVRIHPDLPSPPDVPYQFLDAVMEEPDDLSSPRPGPLGLLHDLAALAAAIEREAPHRTLSGTVARADAKRLGALLGFAGPLEDDPRWGMAMRGLEALRGVTVDPLTRALELDHGLEASLAGSAADALDRLIRRLVESDLHPALPAMRAALRAANTLAIDEVIFADLMREQHREVLFPAWGHGTRRTYPQLGDAPAPAYNDDHFGAIEGAMLAALVSRLTRIGVLRRSDGVFSATRDGRVWAGAADTGPSAPPLWVSSDLEIVVPPDAITPGERFQLERIARGLSRDVVDRYKLDRPSLENWLATHELDEAIALLHRRAAAVPANVDDTLRNWARSALRVTLTRGVLIGD
jgi:hypothetical protein